VTAAGVSPERIQLIHNWTPEEDAEPLPIGTSELREELDLVGRFVVLYSGNLGVTHTFDEVLAVAAGSDVAEDAVFVFIGDGARKAEVERAASSISPTRIRSVPFQPPERLHQSLALADVHLVTLRPGFEGVVVPSKAYGAMGSGRPVIYVGDERGEIARVIHEESAGLVVAPGDADGLARAVEHYRTNPEAQRLDGGRAARVARGRLGRDAAMDAWTTMLVSRFATRSED
jgi:glycosyltransferase involved in cell wall biosynthesis